MTIRDVASCRFRLSRAGAVIFSVLLVSGEARAAEGEGEQEEAPVLVARLAEQSPRVRWTTADGFGVTLGGYVEAYYAYNFGRPANGITEFRAFDNQHDSFTVQAAALDVGASSRQVEARVVLQTGTGPATYYGASESRRAGTALTPTTDAGLWRHVQQAWLAWKPTAAWTVDAGLFLTPIGPESMPTNKNHHWSHSVMFFALPFYHAGARVRYQASDRHAVRLGVFNGWNNATDNNADKSFLLDYAFTPSAHFTLGAAYFAGVERPKGAPEGRPVRHLFDASAVWQALSRLTVSLHADGGFEPNRFGVSSWIAGSVSPRVRIAAPLFASVRGTVFAEQRAHDANGEAAAIALPADRIVSGTATIEAIPARGLSVKLEARQDRASSAIYYGPRTTGDGSAAAPFVPTRRDAVTATLGATAWF